MESTKMRNTGLMRSLVAVGLLAGLAGTTEAQRAVDLPGQDRVLTGSPEMVYSVGVEEGDETQTFATITGVAFDGSGNLYVLDRGNARVVVFGPNGRFVRQIGSKGEGPGEFAFPVGMGVFPNGSVGVMDLGNGAVSMFDAAGKYQSIVRADPQLAQARLNSQMVASADNTLLLAGSQMMMTPNSPPQVSDSLPILRVTTDGSNRTTVVHRTFNKGPELQVSGDTNRREVRMAAPPEFTPQVSWTALPDGGLAVSPGATWDVAVIGADGRVSAVLKRPMQARRVTDRDKDMRKEQIRERLESGAGQIQIQNVNGRQSIGTGPGMPPQAIEQRLASTVFAEMVPVVRSVRADAAGRIWVQRDGGPGNADYPIDIVTPAGEYFGTVKGMALPDAFGPSGLTASIETDDLGVERVVVRRIPQTWQK